MVYIFQRPISLFEEEENEEFDRMEGDSQWEVKFNFFDNGETKDRLQINLSQSTFSRPHLCILHLFMIQHLQTLHDLMDESELENLSPTQVNLTVSSADRKRHNLEENMRREAEERQRKKRELMVREKEYEKVEYMQTCTVV